MDTSKKTTGSQGNEMAVTLVHAKVEDAEALKAISVEAFTDDYELYGSYPPGIESLDWHKAEIETGHYYKILYGDELAGGIYVIPTDDDQIEIKYIFISGGFQNKRIGSATMELIETQYSNARVWTLVTPCKAYRNHHFYEKFGYSKVGEIQPDPNTEFKLYEYRKEVRNIDKDNTC